MYILKNLCVLFHIETQQQPLRGSSCQGQLCCAAAAHTRGFAARTRLRRAGLKPPP